MIKESINEASIGDVIKVDGKYLIRKEQNRSSIKKPCKGCYFLRYYQCMKPLDVGTCTTSDGSLIFQEIDKDKGLPLVKDIEVLERLSKEYPGKTLENIQMQLQARFKELNK